MSLKPSVAMHWRLWKEEIEGRHPMNMLSIPAQAFSGFNIHISVAILDSADYVARKVENKAWRPRFRAYSDKEELTRTMLIIKKENTGGRHPERWELPQGELHDFDVNVEAAIARIVFVTTGLHVSHVLGAPVSPERWQRNGSWHYGLLYVVLVNKITSIDTLAYVQARLSHDYNERCWVRTKDEISMPIPTSTSSSTPSRFAPKSGILPWTIWP